MHLYHTFAGSVPKSPRVLFPIISFSLTQSKLFNPGAVPCGPWDVLMSTEDYLHPCLVWDAKAVVFLRNSEQKLPQRANYPYLHCTAQSQAGITETSTNHFNILHGLWHGRRLHPGAAPAGSRLGGLRHTAFLLQSCLLPSTAMPQESWLSPNSVVTIFGQCAQDSEGFPWARSSAGSSIAALHH